MKPQDTTQEEWARFFDRPRMRRALLSGAIFIAAYEMAKDQIIGHLRYFFADEFTVKGVVTGDKYRQEVLSKGNNEGVGAALWFLKSGAISEADLQTLKRATELRNDFAHRMSEQVTKPDVIDESQIVLKKLVEVLGKIDSWWVFNVEAGIAPEDYPSDLRQEDVLPGSVFAIAMLHEIALGEEEPQQP